MQWIGQRPAAVARLRGGEGDRLLRGTVYFYQRRGGVLVVADVVGLPSDSGFHGFHIHAGTDCGGKDFADSQGHFNPQNSGHPNHAGDLPPLLNCGGRAYLAVLTDRFSIRDILGRTVMIHSGRDDFTTQPAGDSGRKIACGTIVKNS